MPVPDLVHKKSPPHLPASILSLMISHLRGTLLEKHPNQVIVDVQGVGYEVTIPVSAFSSLPDQGAQVRLHIHTHVREDALALFGFLTHEDKQLFEKLIAVSGIGPKLAITALERADQRRPARGDSLRRGGTAGADSRRRQEDRRAHGAGAARQAGPAEPAVAARPGAAPQAASSAA